MSTLGVNPPETSGSLEQRQRRRSAGSSPLAFPSWIAATAERNEHRFGGFLLVAGVASVVWGAIVIGLAAVILIL